MDKLSYKQMVIDSMLPQKPDEKTMHTLDVTECFIERAREHHPENVEEFLIKISGSLNNCHFTKDTSCWAVSKMVPVGMSVDNFMDIIPSCDEIERMVTRSYENARARAKIARFETPVIHSEYNKYDKYVVFAMFYADYWLMNPTNEMASDFTYCYLSDPDYPTTHKIWDYLMK